MEKAAVRTVSLLSQKHIWNWLLNFQIGVGLSLWHWWIKFVPCLPALSTGSDLELVPGCNGCPLLSLDGLNAEHQFSLCCTLCDMWSNKNSSFFLIKNGRVLDRWVGGHDASLVSWTSPRIWKLAGYHTQILHNFTSWNSAEHLVTFIFNKTVSNNWYQGCVFVSDLRKVTLPRHSFLCCLTVSFLFPIPSVRSWNKIMWQLHFSSIPQSNKHCSTFQRISALLWLLIASNSEAKSSF